MRLSLYQHQLLPKVGLQNEEIQQRLQSAYGIDSSDPVAVFAQLRTLRNGFAIRYLNKQDGA